MDKKTLYQKYWETKANGWLKNALLVGAMYVISLILEYHWIPDTMVGLAMATAGLVITSASVTWCYTRYADYQRKAEAIKTAKADQEQDKGYQIGYVPSK